MPKRAAIIITDAHRVSYQTPRAAWRELDTSEQLLADLRTLAALPDLLRFDDDPPSILQTPVTLDNATLLAALEAAARVRAALGGDDA